MPLARPLVFLALLILFKTHSNVSVAQMAVADGFMVTKTYDTIQGKFESFRLGFENKLVFAKVPSAKITVIRPSDVEGLFSNSGTSYESKVVNGRMVFLRVLSKGAINLYSDGKDLYFSGHTGSVEKLRGGIETVSMNGKSYAQSVETYKSQIRAYVDDPSLNAKVAELYFNEKRIVQLVKEINGDSSVAKKPRLHNRSYFSFDAALSMNSIHRIVTDLDFPSETHKVNSLLAGLSFRRKVGTTRSYLGVGLHYEHTPKATVEERHRLHSKILIRDGVEYTDTTGVRYDLFSYGLSSMNFTFGFYPELSYGRIRPFFDLGFSTKYFIKKEASVQRTVYEDDVPVEETHQALKMPSFAIGPRVGLGFRYLIDMNRSISIGSNIEKFWIDDGHMDRVVVKRFYVSYGF